MEKITKVSVFFDLSGEHIIKIYIFFIISGGTYYKHSHLS